MDSGMTTILLEPDRVASLTVDAAAAASNTGRREAHSVAAGADLPSTAAGALPLQPSVDQSSLSLFEDRVDVWRMEDKDLGHFVSLTSDNDLDTYSKPVAMGGPAAVSVITSILLLGYTRHGSNISCY
ncbi:hypothetical protein BHM03_00055272 [Ensete ventricosum]|nr:hypothetical protein BHM03_00055272 [Ensete ventricosum]